eukprot:6812601-Prymnesium_polylepis.1
MEARRQPSTSGAQCAMRGFGEPDGRAELEPPWRIGNSMANWTNPHEHVGCGWNRILECGNQVETGKTLPMVSRA